MKKGKEMKEENSRGDFGVTVVGYCQKGGVVEPVTDATLLGRVLAQQVEMKMLNAACHQELS